MFGLLKNKLSNFIKGLTGREEKKEEPLSEKKEEPAQALPEKIAQGWQKIEAKPQTQASSPTGQPLEKKPETIPAGLPKTSLQTPHEKTVATKPAQEISDEKAKQPKHAPEKTEAKTELPKTAPTAGEEKKPEVEKPSHIPIAASKPALSRPPLSKPAQEAASKVPATPAPIVMAQVEHRKSLIDSVTSVFSGKKTETQRQTPTGEPPAKNPPAQKPSEEKPPETKPESVSQKSPVQPDISKLERKVRQEKRDMAPKIGLGTAIKSFFSNEITIGEDEVADLLDELELSLLEADVAYDVSLEVTSQLRGRLVGMKVPKGEVEKRTGETVRQVLEGVMESGRRFDFLSRVKSAAKPVKILFVGPNGAGKTTTMAKMARMLLDAGLTAVFSASDTFRAAAIEQTEVHAGRLGVKAVKSKYGADPASVAFDAINFAKANSIDVVLIDSAGRQDTNANLLSELKKINRVASPDIKIYVGESIGGNSVIEQIKAFDSAIGLDGAILTKIDCDAKGGTAISIAKTTGLPILFLGIGQGYGDLVPFDAHKLAQELMA